MFIIRQAPSYYRAIKLNLFFLILSEILRDVPIVFVGETFNKIEPLFHVFFFRFRMFLVDLLFTKLLYKQYNAPYMHKKLHYTRQKYS